MHAPSLVWGTFKFKLTGNFKFVSFGPGVAKSLFAKVPVTTSSCPQWFPPLGCMRLVLRASCYAPVVARRSGRAQKPCEGRLRVQSSPMTTYFGVFTERADLQAEAASQDSPGPVISGKGYVLFQVASEDSISGENLKKKFWGRRYN